MKDERGQVRPVPLDNLLNELARSKPSDVMSRYLTSAKNFSSTHVAFGFLMALVSFGFGLITVSSGFLIWLEAVRDHPVPTLPMQTRSSPCCLPRYSRPATRVFDKADHRKLTLLHGFVL